MAAASEEWRLRPFELKKLTDEPENRCLQVAETDTLATGSARENSLTSCPVVSNERHPLLSGKSQFASVQPVT